MTLGDICNAVLTEYKEPITGSNAVPLDYVEDMVNTVYFDIFNRPELQSYKRETDYTFMSKAEQLVGAGGVLSGAVSLLLDDSSLWPATGTACINNRDFFAYTANAANTLTGVTGIQADHDEGDRVELSYALPTDIDAQLLRNPLYVEGAEYTYLPPSQYFQADRHSLCFTVFKGRLYVSATDIQTFTLFYEATLTAMSTPATDKPTMIEGKWRPGLLVSGVVQRIGVRDDMRTGWDWHAQKYENDLKMFIAHQNNPVRSEHPSRRPSVYD